MMGWSTNLKGAGGSSGGWDTAAPGWSTSRKAGSGFSPPDIPGLQLWLRGDLGLTVTSGAVSEWADQSGNANNVLQGTAAKRPTPVAHTPGLNGRPSLLFAQASGQYLVSAAWSTALSGSYTYIAAAVGAASLTPASTLIDDRSTLENCSLFFTPSPIAEIEIFQNNKGQVALAAAATPGPFAVMASMGTSLFALDYKGSTTSGVPSGTNNLTGTTIGALAGGVDSFSGSIAEIMIYAGVLTATQKASIKAYLAARYGLVL